MDNHQFNKFLKMEEGNGLFGLKGRYNEPIWDFVRVRICNWYIDKRIVKKNKVKTSKQAINLFAYIRKSFYFNRRKKYLFIYCPRLYNSDGKLYDKVADNLISITPPKDVVLLSISSIYSNSKYSDHTLFLFNILAYLKILFLKLPFPIYETINLSIRNTFNINIAYKDINNLYKIKMRSYYSYLYCFKFYRPQKVFVFSDEQKGAYLAAKKLGIVTFEFQHGALNYEYPSYSYPKSINFQSNISFADYFIHPGYGWGVNNNIPVKQRIVLGNSSFTFCSNTHNNRSILIISNLPHRNYLIDFTKGISTIYEGLIIYKLHPEEFIDFEEYKKVFQGYTNVKVAPIEACTSELISNCSLMITVASTVYFEAKNLGKRVAVLKYDNYYALEPYVKQSVNSCILESWRDLPIALEMPETATHENYYVPFDYYVAKEIMNMK